MLDGQGAFAQVRQGLYIQLLPYPLSNGSDEPSCSLLPLKLGRDDGTVGGRGGRDDNHHHDDYTSGNYYDL